MADDADSLRRRAIGRGALSIAGFFVALGVSFFLPAGIRWWRGWIFLVVFLAGTIVSSAYLARANPDIFIARSKIRKGTKPWDLAIVPMFLCMFFAMFPLAGFDARYRWSMVPDWLVMIGYAIFALGFAGATWVQAVNKFAEPSARIQQDRGHTVIDAGPYAIVRHPMYVAGIFVTCGIPLALSSFCALIPAAMAAIILIVRTRLEDRMLQNELAGYKSYAARVRHRLLPRIW